MKAFGRAVFEYLEGGRISTHSRTESVVRVLDIGLPVVVSGGRAVKIRSLITPYSRTFT
jgi:hypothetical protein